MGCSFPRSSINNSRFIKLGRRDHYGLRRSCGVGVVVHNSFDEGGGGTTPIHDAHGRLRTSPSSANRGDRRRPADPCRDRSRGQANIIVATGASQFETILGPARRIRPGVDGLGLTFFISTNTSGLRTITRPRFAGTCGALVGRLPLGAFHAVDGQAEPLTECRRLGDLIRRNPIDVAAGGHRRKRAPGL